MIKKINLVARKKCVTLCFKSIFLPTYKNSLIGRFFKPKDSAPTSLWGLATHLKGVAILHRCFPSCHTGQPERPGGLTKEISNEILRSDYYKPRGMALSIFCSLLSFPNLPHSSLIHLAVDRNFWHKGEHANLLMPPRQGRNAPASYLAWNKGFLLKSHQSLWFTFQTTANKNITEQILGTLDALSLAISSSMVSGEEPVVLEGPSISLASSRTNHEDISKKPFTVGDSEVTIPQNVTAFGNKTLYVKVCYFLLVWEVLHVKF